jgi:hypothetical protein
MRSINQVRHFYVANTAATIVDKESATGTIAVVPGSDSIVFKYMSPGGVVTSDEIKKDCILYTKHTLASAMGLKLKKVTLEFAEDPVEGEEYIVKVYFKNYAGAGDDNYTVKYGMAVAKKDDTKITLIKKIGQSLEKNLKDLVPLAVVDYSTEGKLFITETTQSWEVGVKPLAVSHFDVEVMPTAWAKVDENGYLPSVPEPVATVGANQVSGIKVADMEWFHIGARGDMYRGFGHPFGVKTETLADPKKAYDTLDIHYAYVGPNEGVQKSEKTITIAAPTGEIAKIKTTLAEDAGITVG